MVRPEKDHELQIKSFAEMLKLYPEFGKDKRVKLILIGGTRNAQDEKRVEALRSLAKTLDLEVIFNWWYLLFLYVVVVVVAVIGKN